MMKTKQVRRRAEVREVYFVRGEQTGAIKIGVSNDADQRLASLQSGSPEPLSLVGIVVSDAAEALEERLHIALKEHRLRGEWFRPAPEVEAVVAAHALSPRFARFQWSRNQLLRAGRLTALQVAQSLERHPDCPRLAA